MTSVMLRKQGAEMTSAVDSLLRETPPWKVVLATAGATLSAAIIYSQFNQRVFAFWIVRRTK